MNADLVSEVMALAAKYAQACVVAERRMDEGKHSAGTWTEVDLARDAIQARLTELLAGESVAWMRPWEGDVSDENHFLFVSDANERDGMEWVPLFRSPAAATAALQARVTELEGVLRRYVAQDIAGDHFHGTKFEASSLHKDARAALNKEPKNV